jgi:hypothetical protein
MEDYDEDGYLRPEAKLRDSSTVSTRREDTSPEIDPERLRVIRAQQVVQRSGDEQRQAVIDSILTNYKPVSMKPDGYCGYHAAAYVLYGHQDRHVDVMKMILEFLEADNDNFFTFHNDTTAETRMTYDLYLSNLRTLIRNPNQRAPLLPMQFDAHGHFTIIARLCGITLYVLSIRAQAYGDANWIVYRPTEGDICRGYACIYLDLTRTVSATGRAINGGHYYILESKVQRQLPPIPEPSQCAMALYDDYYFNSIDVGNYAGLNYRGLH